MSALQPSDEGQVKEAVSEYYGKTLSQTADLKTSACMLDGEVTADTARILRNVHPDVLSRFYGCGSPIAPLLAGMTTLDLGCGTGRDVYVCAQLCGPSGMAIGVDMTQEQLDVAEEHEAWHAAKFGFSKPNTLFVHGDIANLKGAGIADSSVDVLTSNCVLNLASDKGKVLREVWRVLKPGGELYFSDVFTDRRVPLHLQQDRVLWGECLSGALYRGDFARLMRTAGFACHWIVTSRPIRIEDAAIKAQLGPITFFSETVRAFKLPATAEEGSEDYGQTVTYRGTIAGFPHAFSLGLGAMFITDVRAPVDGNTALALSATRYSAAFKVGARKDHRGQFGGGRWGAAVPAVFVGGEEEEGAAAACCAPRGDGGSSCC